MLRYAILAVAAAGLTLGHSAPASANAATSGVANAPAVSKSVVVDVRRRGGSRHFGKHRGGKHWGKRSRRHWGGRHHRYRHHRHRRHYGGIYFGAPYLYYGYRYGSCRWLYRKAVRTGSRYWWRRYYRCRNYY